LKALKKGFLVLIVGVIIVFLSFLPWDMFLPPWNVVQSRDWIINSGAEEILQVDLLWGATIQGQIWCYGGNNDIDFIITDSGGKAFLNPGKIYNEHRFRWHVPYNDIYSLKFDNTFSGSSKDVGYLISSYYYMYVFLISGAILVTIGLFLVLKEVAKTAMASSERNSKQPSPILVEEESKKLIEGLQKETEDLKSAVKDLQSTIVDLLERAREPKSD
jgi:hypothetical protein